jgi:hypothetical protein
VELQVPRLRSESVTYFSRPFGTHSFFIDFPRTFVLGYFQPVPTGLGLILGVKPGGFRLLYASGEEFVRLDG